MSCTELIMWLKYICKCVLVWSLSIHFSFPRGILQTKMSTAIGWTYNRSEQRYLWHGFEWRMQVEVYLVWLQAGGKKTWSQTILYNSYTVVNVQMINPTKPVPTLRGRWLPTIEFGSARGFWLLEGSFFSPLLPSARSSGKYWVSLNKLIKGYGLDLLQLESVMR